jgi:hydroxymethylpyrimidine/phosphomethylpyrimidine kinase
VLSIAASDPSGGAGIQADLKTFAACGCYGMAAITALTAQNTMRVSAVHVLPSGFVFSQVAEVFADIEVAAVKVGMLGSAENVEVVARVLSERPSLPVVIDPVLVATSGAILADDAIIEAMCRHLFPLATIVTPNLSEAARLGNAKFPETRADVERLARALRAEYKTAWLLKGGHATGASADDLLLDGEVTWLSSPRLPTRNTHGTGCTLSSAIAARLAQGKGLHQAVADAKAYVDRALAGAARLRVGHGSGPLDHFPDG